MASSKLAPPTSISTTVFSTISIVRASSSRGTVKEMSVWSSVETFCSIMSTLTFSSASARNTFAAMPGRSGTRKIVTFASETSWVTPEMIGASIPCSSSCTQVPVSHVKLDRTWTGTR